MEAIVVRLMNTMILSMMLLGGSFMFVDLLGLGLAQRAGRLGNRVSSCKYIDYLATGVLVLPRQQIPILSRQPADESHQYASSHN